MSDDIFDPRHEIWGAPAWPSWFTGFRDHQKDAIADIASSFASGTNVVILNAPTGAGKTVIAEATRRLLEVPKCVYVANTKGLQDQFLHDYPYAAMMKGRNNYPTSDHPRLFQQRQGLSCADCTKEWVTLPACNECGNGVTDNKVPHCMHCHPVASCPYTRAVNAATSAHLAITNTAFFLADCNGPERFTKLYHEPRTTPPLYPRKDQLVIVDECDTLESILMGQIETDVSKRTRDKYHIGVPTTKGKSVKADTWRAWMEETHHIVGDVARGIAAQHRHPDPSDPDGEGTRWNPGVPTEVIREWKTLGNLMDRLALLDQDLKIDNAVYTGWDKGNCTFKPVRVNHYGQSFVWRHADRWLLMSATVIDPVELVQSLGIEEAGLSWDLVNVPSTFPVENRPVYVRGIANMTRKEKETAWPLMADGVLRVLEKHPKDRVLIHTVSYDLAEFLVDQCEGQRSTVWNGDRDLLTYRTARERESTLEQFRAREASVLFAPSMDRGVDLPEDDCRVIVITKIPFPNMGDQQIKQRMYASGGSLWYAVQTVRSLVQMTGRGVRSADDTCAIYVLDKQFMSNIWSKSQRLLPDWWKDAIDWSGGGI